MLASTFSTLFGMVTSVKSSHPSKLLLPIVVNDAGSTIFFNPLHPSNALLPIVFKSFDNSILSSFVVPLNASFPIVVTVAGILKDSAVIKSQFPNILFGIVVVPSAKVTFCNPVHSIKGPFP